MSAAADAGVEEGEGGEGEVVAEVGVEDLSDASREADAIVPLWVEVRDDRERVGVGDFDGAVEERFEGSAPAGGGVLGVEGEGAVAGDEGMVVVLADELEAAAVAVSEEAWVLGMEREAGAAAVGGGDDMGASEGRGKADAGGG